MYSDTPPTLEVFRASKHFDEVPAFAEISFSLRAGQVTAIAGPNGGGKTTLLRCIVGLLLPDSTSDIRVMGETPSSSIAIRRHIGYIPDEADLLDQLTGTEYIQLVAATYQANGAAVLKEAYLLAQQLELAVADLQQKLISGYSHGMRKKLQIIACLAVKPALLVIDEPTNGLDPSAIILLKQVLKRQQEAAILLASHNLAFAQEMASHVLLLKQEPLFYGEMARAFSEHDTDNLEQVYERLVISHA